MAANFSEPGLLGSGVACPATTVTAIAARRAISGAVRRRGEGMSRLEERFAGARASLGAMISDRVSCLYFPRTWPTLAFRHDETRHARARGLHGLRHDRGHGSDLSRAGGRPRHISSAKSSPSSASTATSATVPRNSPTATGWTGVVTRSSAERLRSSRRVPRKPAGSTCGSSARGSGVKCRSKAG